MTLQRGLCWTLSETESVGFLMHRIKSEPLTSHEDFEDGGLSPLILSATGYCMMYMNPGAGGNQGACWPKLTSNLNELYFI